MKRNKQLWMLTLMIVIGVITYFAITGTYFSSNDIMDHNDFARMLINHETVNFAHQGYHWILIILHFITRLDLEPLSILLMTGVIIYYTWWTYKELQFNKENWLIVSASSFVVLGMAVYNMQIGKIYFAQFANMIYHNPTFLLVRVLGVILVVKYFKAYKKDCSYIDGLLIGLGFAFSSWIKPNFAITFFGALFILFLFDLFKKIGERYCSQSLLHYLRLLY